MPVYDYEAVDKRGRIVKAQVTASDEHQAKEFVYVMGYFVTKVTERIIAPRDGAKDAPGGAQT